MSQPASYRESQVRLADILSALSMALNLTMGFHTEHAIRTCYLSMKLADYLKLSSEEKIGIYYGALLKDIG